MHVRRVEIAIRRLALLNQFVNRRKRALPSLEKGVLVYPPWPPPGWLKNRVRDDATSTRSASSRSRRPHKASGHAAQLTSPAAIRCPSVMTHEAWAIGAERLRELKSKRDEVLRTLVKLKPMHSVPPYLYEPETIQRFQGRLREAFLGVTAQPRASICKTWSTTSSSVKTRSSTKRARARPLP